MKRRTALLGGALAASVAALLAFGPDPDATLRKLEAKFGTPPPLPPQSVTQIDDPTGALDVARTDIEAELGRFGRDLGIGLRIVTTQSAGDPQQMAAALLASETAHAWHATGIAVFVLHTRARRVCVAGNPEFARVAPNALIDSLLAARVGPFLDQPLGGVALASGLARLRDHLLAQVAAGTLVLDDAVSQRSIATHVADRERASAARCEGVASEASADVASSAEAFACALLRGDTSANAALFTESSRVQLARKPLLAFESRVRAAALDAGRPWSISQVENRAAVLPVASTPDFVPVLLVREQGVWRVDLVEMGKTFRARGSYWKQANARGPYWLALGATPGAGEFDTELTPVELWGEPLADAIARLERTDGPVAKVRLAELLLRNAWLPGEALIRWNEALALLPDDLATANTFADRAEYLGHPLLGAIAIAPFGPATSRRLAILLLRAGNIDAGAALLRHAHEWRASRDARRAEAAPESGKSI